jgi:hypothetical protein
MTLAVGLSPVVRDENLPEVTWEGLEAYLSQQKTPLILLDGYVDVPLLTERFLTRKDKSVTKADLFSEHLFRFSRRGNCFVAPTVQIRDADGNVISDKKATKKLLKSIALRAMFDITKFLVSVDA